MTDTVSYAQGQALQVLSFEVGAQTYCVPVSAVREIRGVTPPTPLPEAPPYVRGVINLRGQVMPVHRPCRGASARAPPRTARAR